MFKKIIRKIRKNPFDVFLSKLEKKKYKKILICWNRGIGDVPLGLYAIVKEIKKTFSDVKITFLIREDLKEVFSLFPYVDVIEVPFWKRGEKYNVKKTLKKLFFKNFFLKNDFDFIIKKPDPTYWVFRQIGKVVPKLKWKKEYDELYKKFSLDKDIIGVQTESDTSHSEFRDWPKKRWEELFCRLKDRKIVIFGKNNREKFLHKNVIDLRGKTTFLEVLSIIKNRCSHVVLPDGGILSTIYYLDENFPIKIISLWQDRQGVLKQDVLSSNNLCMHFPIIARKKSIHEIKAKEVLKYLC